MGFSRVAQDDYTQTRGNFATCVSGVNKPDLNTRISWELCPHKTTPVEVFLELVVRE